MGLTVEVGILLDLLEGDPEGAEEFRAQLDEVAALLRANGLPPHDEPTTGDWEVVSLDLGGYSSLHHLRRIAAHLAAGRPLPDPGGEAAPDDPVLQAAYEAPPGRFAHLLHHSDAEGFYVPVDFPLPLDGDVAGETLGSSVALRRELGELAQALGIPPGVDPEGDELWQALQGQGAGENWRRYGAESFACVRLLAAAEASVTRGAALVFI